VPRTSGRYLWRNFIDQQARILFACRDPGEAGHILALLKAFRENSRFTVELVASGVAFNMLRDCGESPRLFPLEIQLDYLEPAGDFTELITEARTLLEEVKPDAVFVSVSSLGVGVDEALLAACQVPSFAIQDFWGDINLGIGTPADVYFVLDEFAAQVSHSRWGVKTIPVGSPKHTRYQSLDVDLLRQETRSNLGVLAGRPVIGFFGQSSRIPGHEKAFSDLATAVSNMENRPLFLLRDHGKFPDDRHAHMKLLNGIGVAAVDVTNESTAETWLAACDVVVTCFSTCALDHAYLSAYAREPVGTVIYALCNPEILAFVSEMFGFPIFPTVEQGLGKVANDPASIAPLLEASLMQQERSAYHAASKRLSIRASLAYIMDIVMEAVGSKMQTLD